MNPFIDYLNSINNISGNPTGSLAEKQVKSEYFSKVQIDRALGEQIAESVKKQTYKTYILTGHAGDGKTSVLVQVLRTAGMLSEGEGLLEEGDYDHFYYVKDMSEIPVERQDEVLLKALSAPSQNKTSLLISNTGPLLKSFAAIAKAQKEAQGSTFSIDDEMQIQSQLLNQLDKNDKDAICIDGHTFVLINMARLDNVVFAAKLLDNLLKNELWNSCYHCEARENCPILNNQKCLTTHFVEVSAFIENYYRYLYENDKRMTIRQMVAQLSYAITGNLTCQKIKSNPPKNGKFDYNFANLFFGYVGMKSQADAIQIKGIEQIQKLGLDSIALDVDYNLFVKHEYSCFSKLIADELEALQQRNRKFYRTANSLEDISVEKKRAEAGRRCAVRRFYLMFHLTDQPKLRDEMFNQIFGALYSRYRDLISKVAPKSKRREISELIFRALYMKNTGFLPVDQDKLPLTLRREDEMFQSVMLILGEIPKNALEVTQEKNCDLFGDNKEMQRLYLRINEKNFGLSLPLITYFYNLVRGSISSNQNPALTHGVAALDALLITQYGDDTARVREECELKILINTVHGQEIRRYEFESSCLNIT